MSSTDGDSDAQDDVQKNLKALSFEQLLKVQQEVGASNFNEAYFGKSHKKPSVAPRKVKRASNDAPLEMSAKKPVPLLGQRDRRREAGRKFQPRDPRFDAKCGEYDGSRFRKDFEFAFNLRQEELATLKRQLKEAEDAEERKRLQFLVQRLQNQIREYKKNKTKDEEEQKRRQEMKEAREQGRRPFYDNKSQKRKKELVERFKELKESGRLKKHIEKRRKKMAGKSRKKMDI